MMTLIFPCCSSAASLDSRILRPVSMRGVAQTLFQPASSLTTVCGFLAKVHSFEHHLLWVQRGPQYGAGGLCLEFELLMPLTASYSRPFLELCVSTDPPYSSIFVVQPFTRGSGFYPDRDPWGRLLGPERQSRAGSEITPGFRVVLDGIQCDQDFARSIFDLSRHASTKQCCFYCVA